MAMSSIDNSVELMIKTYLKLPSRVTGAKGLSRSKYEEKTKYFNSLLDTFEEIAPEKLVGIDLGDIEWYHGLRNQLYHDGIGITVDKVKVEAYAEIAKILFFNLFKLNVDDFIEMPHSLVGEFINSWALFEQELFRVNANKLDEEHRFVQPMIIVRNLAEKNIIPEGFVKTYDIVRRFKNELVHGEIVPSTDYLKKYSNDLEYLLRAIREIK